MKKIQPWQTVGLILSLGVLLLCWKVFHLSFSLSIAAAIVAFFLYRTLAKKGFKAGQLEDQHKEMVKERGDLMKEAQRDLSVIRRDTYRTPLGPIRDEAKKLLKTGTTILDYLEKNPQQVSKSRRFLGYYLDTAAKVMEKYAQVHETKGGGLQLAEMDEITRGALVLLNEAFEKQLKSMLENDMIDLEGDINLMEMMLNPGKSSQNPEKSPASSPESSSSQTPEPPASQEFPPTNS